MIDALALHEAADQLGQLDDLGIDPAELGSFVNTTSWVDGKGKPWIEQPHPFSLALGVIVGATAVREQTDDLIDALGEALMGADGRGSDHPLVEEFLSRREKDKDFRASQLLRGVRASA